MESKSPSKFRNSITLKLVVIGVISMALLIPSNMLQSLVREREYTQQQVINEVSSSWGNQQTVVGPLITVPYKSNYKVDDTWKTRIEYLHILPEKLDIKGNVQSESRGRSIYNVVVYTGHVDFKGGFKIPEHELVGIEASDILWEKATMDIGISDMRGIEDDIKLKVDNKLFEVDPGIPQKDILSSGISAPLKLEEGKSFNFQFKLSLKGSKQFNFIPIGKTTQVNVVSDWPSPSFNGAFLPDERDVRNDGFEASWKVLHLNRNFPQIWKGQQYNIHNSYFGFELLLPVDHYQKVNRAVKYAIMFIALTFVIFFFSEILLKVRIHPIQYLLAGIGLLVFYSLLLSVSEHWGFSAAYLISSAMIIALIVFYYQSIIKSWKSTLVILFVLIALYVFLFTILQIEAYALLMGSIGLFIALAIIMFVSKGINWYESRDSSSKTLEKRE